ncbi:uncharacterized protein DDB_G0284459-like isoform X2 [Contarinia nasturtii]|nr:uncharacterized protein DDB_G0284459-like isoform X2 [Contarinia nasturtii]
MMRHEAEYQEDWNEKGVISGLEIEFWHHYVNCIESGNKKFIDNLDDSSDEFCKKICDFNVTVNLYNRDLKDWSETDGKSTRLTVLLGICDLEEFVCDTCELFETHAEGGIESAESDEATNASEWQSAAETDEKSDEGDIKTDKSEREIESEGVNTQESDKSNESDGKTDISESHVLATAERRTRERKIRKPEKSTKIDDKTDKSESEAERVRTQESDEPTESDEKTSESEVEATEEVKTDRESDQSTKSDKDSSDNTTEVAELQSGEEIETNKGTEKSDSELNASNSIESFQVVKPSEEEKPGENSP